MIRKINLALFCATLLLLFFLAEIFMRLYGVELRIGLSNFSRKTKISSYRKQFLNDIKNLGVTDKTFNIYFLGESTMWGVPYGPELSIPNLVEYRLGQTLGGRPVRIINLASAAKDVAYVRYAFDLLMREKNTFHPSLIVIYSGHNEFLKFHPSEPDYQTPIFKWLIQRSEIARELLTVICRSKGEILEIDNRDFFDRSIFPFDKNGYQKVIDQYHRHFLHMIDLSEKNKVPLVISTLVSNYSSWEPNRSIFCHSSAAEKQKEQFEQLFRDGLAAEKQNDDQTALSAYQKAISICDRFSEAYFREGITYKRLHDYESAWTAFQKAIDYDGMPIRGVSAQNDFLLSLERFDHVYVVNSLKYLRESKEDGLLDERLIIDGIHPNLNGYLLISEAISKEISSLFSKEDEKLNSLDPETAKVIFHINTAKIFDVSYSTGRWISRLATWRYDGEERFKTAESFFDEAIQIYPEKYEGYLGLAILSLMRVDNQAAENFLQKAREIDLKSIDGYFQKPWTRKILRRCNLKTSVVLPLSP